MDKHPTLAHIFEGFKKMIPSRFDHMIEGYKKKKRWISTDKCGSQRGLHACTNYRNLSIVKENPDFSRANEEKENLPPPPITEKDKGKSDCSENEEDEDSDKYLSSKQKLPHFGLRKMISNVAMYLRDREILARPSKHDMTKTLKIQRYMYMKDLEEAYSKTSTDRKLQTALYPSFYQMKVHKCDHEEVGTNVDLTELPIKVIDTDEHEAETDVALPEYGEKETVCDQTHTEIDVYDTHSDNSFEMFCDLSTLFDEEKVPNSAQTSHETDVFDTETEEKERENISEVEDCIMNNSFESEHDSSQLLTYEKQPDTALVHIGVKIRMNVVKVLPAPDANPNVENHSPITRKKLTVENDPVKILSRTQMMMPRISEWTVFTVIGIIERLALGQQVPAKESMKYEMLRFCTFRQYPPSGKPSTIRLAKAGFYYATNRDEVICYCCAKRISNWKENDDPLLAHKHVTPNCDFLLKNSEVNIPISITDESDVIQRLLRLEFDPVFVNQVFNETSTEALERLNNLLTDSIGTDGRTNDDPSNIDVTSNTYRANRDSPVAKDSIPAGSFANSLPPVGAENINESDRRYMSLVGEDVNNAAKLSTFNKMENMTGIMVSNLNMTGIMVSNMAKIPDFVNTKSEQPTDDSSTDLTRGLSTSSTTSSNSTQSTRAISQSNLAPQLPSTITSTLLPKSSHIPTTVNAANGVTVNSAVATTLPKYPKYSTRAARHASFRECQQIAVQIDFLCDAGFFYAGSGDSTRCFFCGIGLRHWSPDDDPWTEHARFSLKCLFVLEQKGQEFINIVKLAVEVSEKASKNAVVANTDVMKSEAAVSALAMGYTADQVRKAIETINARTQTSVATNGNHQLSGQDILEEIFRIEEGSSTTNSSVANTEHHESEADNLEEQGAWAETIPQRSQSDLLPLGSSRLQVQQRAASDSVVQSDLERKKKRLLQENKMLRSASLCTQCHRREICMVFLPCGHLVTCEECGKATRTCTTCASRVKGTVRTYMA
ncbi:uncharacterized protein LOC127834078 isoform X2 [Dreissena polymorpha]|uniref:uncharacterized protein LOC127834078 isoform X2 n=1 Tax=Dreissena polymorpha TaxID=45954 RepID=UPI0022654E02|nr:uncharacterized protein LOC127834078 isoform X2 [Dreissena polymorpha]